MDASIWMDGIRSLFAGFDKLIYFLIEWCYELMMKLAEVQIFQEGQITNFATRVYSLIGIFMLFKISFSLVNYLVNPDTVTDNKTGGSKIVRNVIITLVLIIIVPLGFDLLYRAQYAILKDQILPKFILGNDETDLDGLTFQINPEVCGDTVVLPENNGSYIALMAFKPFYQLYDYEGEKGINVGDQTPLRNAYCTADSVSNLLNPVVYEAEMNTMIFANTGSYVVDYQMLWSTVVGVIILLLFISFCFDIAVRTIKLGFLEIIAPIPIISYIDPKSGETGMFSKWFKEVKNTWASLFIRLAAVFFALYIIRMINENLSNGIYEDYEKNYGLNWLMLFLIIGALMFAKQLPRLIEDLLGIKFRTQGTFQLNPFKKIENEALYGKQVVGMPGKAVATVGGGLLSAGGTIAANIKKKQALKQKRDLATQAGLDRYRAFNNQEHAMQEYNAQKNMRVDAETKIRDKAASQMEYEEAKNRADQFYRSHANVDYVNWSNDDKNTYRQLRSEEVNLQLDAINKAHLADGIDATVIQEYRDREDIAKQQLEQAEQEYSTADSAYTTAKNNVEKQEESNDTYSYNHPVQSAIIQALRGAKIGFNSKDTANLAHAITAGVNAAKKATEMRNNYDRFGFLERMRDLGTDITGVRNESGTTSEVQKEIKKQQEILNNIKNGINSLNHTFANLKPGAIAYDNRGNITLNMSGTYHYAAGERESVEHLINQYNMLRQSEKDTTKQIKEFQAILDSKGKNK